MKVSEKILRQLISEILPGAEVVDGDDGATLDEIKEKISASIGENLKPVIEKDLRDNLKTQLAGEIGQKELKTLMKSFSISDKKLLEGKTLDEQVEIVKKLHADSLKMNVDDWNKEKEQLINSHLTEKETWENEKTTLNNQWQEKYDYRDISGHVMAALEKLPRTKGGDLSMQTDLYLDSIKRNGLSVKYNQEKQRLDFYKDNQLHVADGKTLDDKAHMKDWAKKTGILMEDNRNVNPTDYLPGNGQQPQSNPKNDMYAAAKQWAGATPTT